MNSDGTHKKVNILTPEIKISILIIFIHVLKMKLHWSSYFWALITILGLIQAFRLYYVSTRDLRQANEKDNWYIKQKPDTTPTKLVHAGLQNAIQMGDSPEKIFYFIQVSQEL